MTKTESKSSLWLMKAHYFLWNAGTAPVTPFLSIYSKHLGFSSVDTGIMFTVLPITGMLAKPALGAIADRFKCQKRIFLTLIISTILAFLCILYVPKLEKESTLHFSCDYGQSVLDTCASKREYDGKDLSQKISRAPNSMASCKVSCPLDEDKFKVVKDKWSGSEDGILHFTAHLPLNLTDTFESNCTFFRVANVTLPDGTTRHAYCPTLADKISANCMAICDSPFITDLLPIKSENLHLEFIFWVFLILMMIAWFSQAVVVSISDAVCFELLGSEPHKYGQQRCFGSLGWGIFSIIAGLILDSGRNGEKNYPAVFYLSAAILLADFFVSVKLKYKQMHTSGNIFKDVIYLLADGRTVIFSVWCVFMGMSTGVIWNFLFWLIEELSKESDWIKTLEGSVMTIQCLGGELPLFFVSGWILKRIGHVNTMTMILLIVGIRNILYSIISNPWYILPVELLNGVTFGLFYACMASYASIVAPPGTGTTVQGSAGALFEIGISLGSFLGGVLFHKCGGSLTFRYFGIASLGACLLHALAHHLYRKWDKGRYVAPHEVLEISDEQQELKFVEA